MDLHHLPPGGGQTGIIRSLFVSKELSVNHFLLFLCLYNQRRKLGHAYISASVHGCQELSKRFGFKDNLIFHGLLIKVLLNILNISKACSFLIL